MAHDPEVIILAPKAFRDRWESEILEWVGPRIGPGHVVQISMFRDLSPKPFSPNEPEPLLDRVTFIVRAAATRLWVVEPANPASVAIMDRETARLEREAAYEARWRRTCPTCGVAA